MRIVGEKTNKIDGEWYELDVLGSEPPAVTTGWT